MFGVKQTTHTVALLIGRVLDYSRHAVECDSLKGMD